MGSTGERIKAIRKTLGMTQEKFAEEIDISVANLRKLEKGANLTIANALAINEKFGYSLDYIFGLTDDTSDTASTMLLYLKKLFRYKYDAKVQYPFTVNVPPPVIDFLKSLAKADELLANGMPQEAYDIWLNQLKKDFNEKMDGHTTYVDTPDTIYKMVLARDLIRLDPKPSQL